MNLHIFGMGSTKPAARVVDAPSPRQSDAGRSTQQHTICTLIADIDELHAENRRLHTELASARSQRDTAKAELASYGRARWGK